MVDVKAMKITSKQKINVKKLVKLIIKIFKIDLIIAEFDQLINETERYVG